MTSGKDIVLNYVVPALGVVITCLMFGANMPAVLKARRNKHIGELNLIPYPAIVANTVGWVAYGMVITNGFIIGSNTPGLIMGLFYTFACSSFAPQRTLDIMGAIIIFFASVLVTVGCVGAFLDMDHDSMRLLWGYTCNAILLCYYAAPLTTLYKVIRARCADSLSLPMCIMNSINGALWLAYGIAISDLFISVPNGIGLAISLVLLSAIFIFWKNRGMSENAKGLDIESNGKGGLDGGSDVETKDTVSPSATLTSANAMTVSSNKPLLRRKSELDVKK